MKLGASRHSTPRDRRDRREGREDREDPDDRKDRRDRKDQKARESSSARPPNPGSTPTEVRPELVDATHYDLDRLERAIDGLVAQQRSLKGQNDVLSERLIERDAQVERLEAELQSADERRKHAIARVDSLIDELDRLDAALDGSMADDPVSDSDTPGTTAGKAVANMSPPSSPSA